MTNDFLKFSIGDLITILSYLGGVIGAVYLLYYRLANIERRLNGVDDELKKQTEILVQLATQRERLNALDKRVDEIFSRLIGKLPPV